MQCWDLYSIFTSNSWTEIISPQCLSGKGLKNLKKPPPPPPPKIFCSDHYHQIPTFPRPRPKSTVRVRNCLACTQPGTSVFPSFQRLYKPQCTNRTRQDCATRQPDNTKLHRATPSSTKTLVLQEVCECHTNFNIAFDQVVKTNLVFPINLLIVIIIVLILLLCNTQYQFKLHLSWWEWDLLIIVIHSQAEH